MKQTFSEEFVASRITRGNIIFPKRIEINEKQITFVTPGVFNTIKKSIYINCYCLRLTWFSIFV